MTERILDTDVEEWLSTASEDDMRELVRVLDANENHIRHSEIAHMLAKECNKRAAQEYSVRGGGEWI